MKRIEIIFSQALEEDILSALSKVPEAQFYTIIPEVWGKGYSTPKMGSPVWPETNEIMIIYCDDDVEPKITGPVKELQAKYTREGLAYFVI
ncbi:MAG TPA: hypothetical protein PLV73_03740 [Treponemataceae bacterium]|nr:MAG: hypothetical protein BWY20_00803 [Spirochaetes bacterium ADurb.Bin215]HOF85312.1 hypothetical protein [Treponemataceae bacterium]HOS34750.1 hypothetical protein [Treponemataceae bacterium]HOU38773.1 hypothetical protein [Treponemataceae bacterium]HPA09915.1 hypothetical protein [Treponemataceae bacterium]